VERADPWELTMPDLRIRRFRRKQDVPQGIRTPLRKRVRALIRHRLVRRLAIAGLVAAVSGAASITGAQLWVSSASGGHLYQPSEVPDRPVALVLGALEEGGRPSGFLAARLDVARELFTAGKVRAILISGDNGRPGYDEPTSGRGYLIERGVPASAIALDYAGFDTYDSCVRAKRVFGVESLTVVTQNYHLPRAVALCRTVGIDAVGAGTDAWESTSHGFVARNRELLANVKAVTDVTRRRDPVFLGPPEPGVRAALAAR
jgi:vancomycin permeability regulator SanA